MSRATPAASRQGVLRDPVFHFAVIGLTFFLGFVFLNDSESRSSAITVSTAQQEQLVAAFTRVWRRPPSGEEMKGLLDDWIREEIANREAVTMGLAANDLVVRRRLRQKFESFMDQIAAATEPGEQELQTWYDDHAADYQEDARYTLRQRFFSSDRRADARADAEMALATLNPINPELDAEVGDALAIPQRFDNSRVTELGNRFGEAFAQRLETLPLGQWVGPIPSAYGFHLVYAESSQPQAQPSLERVRAEVTRDWRAQHVATARDALYSDLLARYGVEIQESPRPTGG